MITPNPALVTHRAAQRLPRPALLLFCGAYLLPGLFGRDPWRNADITSFGYMASIAQGHSPWWAPSLGGLPADGALLPYWLGGLTIRALSPWVDAALAARLPFAVLLLLALAATWYSAYHLARSSDAQPLPFAFGGEADPTDYARAIADGALLAMMATLGLLQLGHETTPELAQLASVASLMYAMASAQARTRTSLAATLLGLPALAASGAPAIACVLGVTGASYFAWSRTQRPALHAMAMVLGTAIAATVAHLLGAWHWRVSPPDEWGDWTSVVRQMAWFTWPTLPLALLTLWRWRRHGMKLHIAVPAGMAVTALLASTAMGGVDRALMLGIPALAVLAAFALPTLGRSGGAAIDWFSVFFFSLSALAIWVVYGSMHTGMPAQPAANIQKLAPGFVARFSLIELMLGIAATVAWVALVCWRTGRHRHPLWKSMVLPASGVALSWTLLMTLWLPLLDYARSDRPLVQRVAQHLPRSGCVSMPGATRSRIAAIEQLGGYRVDAVRTVTDTRCDHLIRQERRDGSEVTPAGWELVARVRRPTDRVELTAIYRRRPAG